jgi:outer membrane protein OmpA-like peptidoglycan-associated protein
MNKLLLLLFTFLSFIPLKSISQIGGFTEPVELGKDINSEKGEEKEPIISTDGSLLFFTRMFDPTSTGGEYDQDIWVSKIKDGEVGKPTALTSINNKFNNSVVGISSDGKTIYLLDAYSGKKDLVKGCSYAKKEGDGWSKPIKLEIPELDIEGDFYGFYMTPDEKVLFISYNGPNTNGEEDLYVSVKTNDIWSKPTNLGSTINSAGYEISPFLTASMDTLFFSSNGRGGEGDADVFYSIRKGDSWTEWSEPENLGNVINTPKFDAYFILKGNTAYWSSNRNNERADLFSSTILPPAPIEVTTDIKNPSAFGVNDGEVSINVSSGQGPLTVKWSDGSTEMNRKGLGGGTYSVTITDKFGISKTIDFEVVQPEMKQKDLDNLLVNVNPIYFDRNKHKIRDDAKIELDKIVKIMNDNPTIQIELGSHTDCLASEKYNLKLSDKRAKASADYIKERISNPERISGQGYGESMLKVDCPCEAKIKSTCSDEEHQLNRRTEFVLIEKGSPKYADIAVKKVTPANPKNTVEVNYNTDAVTKKTKWRTDVPVTDEQRKNMENGFYIVQQGETLYRVSINTGVTTNELRRINNLKSNSIKPGTKLMIR